MPSSQSSPEDWADRLFRDLSDEPPPVRRENEDQLIGGLAVKQGLIRPEDLKSLSSEVEQRRSRGEKISLGELLVRNQVLTIDTLIALLREIGPKSEGIPEIPRYEVGPKLGEGATAIVYNAWDRELKRPVALKLLRESTGFHQIARDRFRREAQAAGAVTHPNVIQVYDAGEVAGRFYIVLELVEGLPLAELIAKGTPREAMIGHLQKAALGVAAAHSKGIVHRDLKPANILIDSSGAAKVGDFGLAHLANSSMELTRTGSTLGTPLYMSPEQVRGDLSGVSPRSDVYALGAILYEILAGRPPHEGETLPELYQKILTLEPPSPRRIVAGVHPDLDTIAMKSLDKEPSRRYPSAAEFSLDLGRAMDGEPISARPEGSARRLWRRTSRSRLILLPALLAVVLGLGLGLSLARRTGVVMATIESLQGEVSVLGSGGRPLARVGAEIVEGSSVETGPPPGHAVLLLPNGGRLEIGPGSLLRTDTGGTFTLATGTAAVLPSGRPCSLRSPEAEVHSAGGPFTMAADVGGTRVESTTGKVTVVRLRDGRSAHLAANTWVRVVSDGGSMEPAPLVERILRVGPGKPFALPSAAAAAATDGAVVEIDAGVYEGDVAIWKANHLTIRGLGGRARVKYSGKLALNRALWLLQGRNTTVENIDFVGSPESGLWFEAPGLTLRHGAFTDNGLPFTGADNPESDLFIEHCEFARNGKGGSSNVICPVQRSMVLRYSYLHRPNGGHQITSHARSTLILYSRLTDEGSPSSMILHALGGSCSLVGNVFSRGANSSMVGPMFALSWGDGALPGTHYFVNNTVIDSRTSEHFIAIGPQSSVRIQNNIFSGSAQILHGKGELANNLVGRDPLFVDPARFDFRLRAGSAAIDGGMNPGNADGFDLHPQWQYVHPAGKVSRPVRGALDLGAFEHEH